MAQQLHTTTDTSFVVILFLLAYVMSSAPRYVKGFHKQKDEVKIEYRSITRNVINAGKNAITPYVKAWKSVKSSLIETEPQQAGVVVVSE